MSITLSADTFTQMTNDINADRAKIKELEEKNKKLVELHNLATTLANKDVKELKAGIEEVKKQNEEQKKAIQSAYEIVPVDTLKEIEELKAELEEWKDAAEDTNAETPGELSSWIEASIHEDDEIYSKYMEPLQLREENKELKRCLDNEAGNARMYEKKYKEAKSGFKLLECVDCKCIVLDDLQGQINKLKEETELNAKKDLHHQLILVDYFAKKVDNVEGITFNQGIVNYCEKLKEENEKSKTDALCFSAQLNFAGEYSDIQDYTQFNEWIKENYKEDEYKKMYEWYVMEDYIEEE